MFSPQNTEVVLFVGGLNSSQPHGWSGPGLGDSFSSRFVSSTAELRASSVSLCGPHRLTQGLVPIRPQALPLSTPHTHTLEAVVFRINKEGHRSVAGPCCLSVVLVPLCICCGPWTSNLTPLSQDSFLCETDVLMPLP